MATRASSAQTRRLFTAIGAGITGGVVANTFACMEIAEEEILVAKKKWPTKKLEIDGVFKFACPTEPLRGKAEQVYQHHIRELIDRARRMGSGTFSFYAKPATKAEVLCIILNTSLRSPLNHEHVRLAQALWSEIMPDKPIDNTGNHDPVETSWTEEASALLSDLRRRFKQDRGV